MMDTIESEFCKLLDQRIVEALTWEETSHWMHLRHQIWNRLYQWDENAKDWVLKCS